MKSRIWDKLMLLGVLFFVADAALMLFGYLGEPMKYTLPVLGLILIGAGGSGKSRNT